MNPINEGDCITESTEFNVYTKYPNHVFDESQGWHFDPSLRVECFDLNHKCCPTIEISSNSYGATFFPQLMGTYFLTDDYQVRFIRFTDSTKINRPGHNIYVYVLNEFSTADCS